MGGDLEVLEDGGQRLPRYEVSPEVRGVRSGDGDASSMVMRRWSAPVEGREISPPLTNGRSRGFAKAKSITEWCVFPERGNLVYTPGGLWCAKPRSTANSKYGVEEETFREEKVRSG